VSVIEAERFEPLEQAGCGVELDSSYPVPCISRSHIVMEFALSRMGVSVAHLPQGAI